MTRYIITDVESQKKSVVAYIRISSQRQINNESPATQREAIQRYADDNNLHIVAWFEDIAKSGKNANRDGLQELLEYCLKHKGQISHWVVYNMRRASRDIESYTSQVRVVLKARGVTVRSATEPVVDDTKMGRFMENLLVLLGQLDNDGKAEVTVDNMRSLALQGYWQHPPVVGYMVHKVPNELGKLRPTLKPSAMAPKVTQVLERFSQGDITKAELARYAKDVGLRSRYGKVLSEDSINRLLKNPVYAGLISDKFTDYKPVKGRHKGLISEEIYMRNQTLLYGKNSRKGEVHIQKNQKYPLKGLVLCWNCAQPLYASAPQTGNGNYSPRYHCARATCRGKVKSVKAQKVHDDFEELLKRVKPSGEILKLYKTVLVREANNELGKLNQHIHNLREELNNINSSRVNAIQKFAEENITLEDKNQLTDLYDAQKAAKTAELNELEQQQNIREADIEVAIAVMDTVDRQWAESGLDVQLRFQKLLFPEGLIYDSLNSRFGTSQISPLYRVIPIEKGAEAPLESYLVAGAGLEPATLWL